MRRSFSFIGLILPLLPVLPSLGLCGAAAAANYDPPHKHYAASPMPADAGLANVKPMGRYRGFLRPSVDLSQLMPPVGDQGELSSGVAWAVAYAARSYYAGRNENRNIESPENEASPSYVYHLARRGGCGENATISSTVDVLRKGALSMAAYPSKADCQDRPQAATHTNGRDFRVKDYRVLDRSQIDDVKSQLERGNPVVVLFRVSPAFEDLRGKEVFREADFAQAAGEDLWQPLTVVGYDEQQGAVRIMNSWGRGWGDEGYAWVSYEALTNRISGAGVLEVAAVNYQQADPRPPEPTLPKVLPPEPKPPEPKPPEPDAQQPAEITPPANEPDKTDDKTPEQPAEVTTPPPKPKPTLANLGALTCGKIDQIRSNGHVTLNGFVANDEDYAKVKEVAL